MALLSSKFTSGDSTFHGTHFWWPISLRVHFWWPSLHKLHFWSFNVARHLFEFIPLQSSCPRLLLQLFLMTVLKFSLLLTFQTHSPSNMFISANFHSRSQMLLQGHRPTLSISKNFTAHAQYTLLTNHGSSFRDHRVIFTLITLTHSAQRQQVVTLA